MRFLCAVLLLSGLVAAASADKEVVVTFENEAHAVQSCKRLQALSAAPTHLSFAQVAAKQVPSAEAAVTAAVLGLGHPLLRTSTAEVCKHADETTSPSHVAAAELGGNAFECPMCKFVVNRLKLELEDPNTEDGIIAEAKMACDSLPADDREMCYTVVNQYAQVLFDMIRDVDPQGVCALASACPPVATATRPAALDALSAEVAKLDSPASNDECDTCKVVVMEVGAILRNPDTQTEILDYAKQACQSFQGFHDQCVQYVTLYGPLAFQMLLQYLQPIPVCSELGFCAKSGPFVPLADAAAVQPFSRSGVAAQL